MLLVAMALAVAAAASPQARPPVDWHTNDMLHPKPARPSAVGDFVFAQTHAQAKPNMRVLVLRPRIPVGCQPQFERQATATSEASLQAGIGEGLTWRHPRLLASAAMHATMTACPVSAPHKRRW